MNTKDFLFHLPKIALAGSILFLPFTALADDDNYTDGIVTINVSDTDRQFIQSQIETADSPLSACTKPEGFVTITVPAGAVTTYFGPPLESPAIYRFDVSALTSDTITFSDAAFATDQFATEGPYWVRIVSGSQAGRHMLIEANTENSVTVDLKDGTMVEVSLNEENWAVQAGDIVEIAPADTLKTFFSGIISVAENPRNAERVSLWSGSRWLSYYNLTSLGWLTGDGNTAFEDIVLSPQEAWAIATNRGEMTTIVLSGTVPEQPLLMRHPGGGANVISANRFPVDQALGDFHFDGPGTWAASANPRSGDTLGVWTGSRWVSYYVDGNNEWKLTTAASDDQSGVSIRSGDVVNILLRNARSGTGQFFSLPLPYGNPRE